jgi:hypothetical protein
MFGQPLQQAVAEKEGHSKRAQAAQDYFEIVADLWDYPSAPKSLNRRVSSTIFRDDCVVVLSENPDSLKELRLALSKNVSRIYPSI